ncbi:uncharacterized protein G2W53_001211 [Senna tora]|uniref:Uncharacterized protein n=1 Tax=Senna tora TaxID=362788 RepID=A0A835CK47_9FABA|nr:uncharacterized protein G2W53_001211 [Senna tora]
MGTLLVEAFTVSSMVAFGTVAARRQRCKGDATTVREGEEAFDSIGVFLKSVISSKEIRNYIRVKQKLPRVERLHQIQLDEK